MGLGSHPFLGSCLVKHEIVLSFETAASGPFLPVSVTPLPTQILHSPPDLLLGAPIPPHKQVSLPGKSLPAPSPSAEELRFFLLISAYNVTSSV